MSPVSDVTDELVALRAENARLRAENAALCERHDELYLSDLRLRRLLESNIIGVLIGSPQGKMSAVNGEFARLVGRSARELEDLDWKSCILPEELAFHEEQAQRLWTTGTCPAWETSFARPDGTRIPVITGATLIDGAQPDPDARAEMCNAEVAERTMLMWALDISGRKQIENDLRESEGRMRAIVENIHDGLLITDLDDNIIRANRRICEMTGYSEAELVGRNAHKLLTDPIHWQSCERRDAERAQGKSGTYEIAIRHRDGSTRWMLINGSPLRDASGESVGTIGAHFDITERKRDETERARFAAQLEKSNRDLETFAFAVSHDLKEPLRKIEVFGSRLHAEEGAKLSPDGSLYLERMRRAAHRMSGLIDGLLAYSRVTTAESARNEVDLNHVAREVMLDLELSVERAGGHIDIGDLPVVRADAIQMRQLLQNLIGNALVYRRPDVPLIVGVSGRIDGGHCEIEVADNGRGFAPEHSEQVFQIFRRLDDTREVGGAGVGLTICRAIVERHGGTLAAQGKPGQGATFRARIPLLPPASETEGAP